MGGPHIFGVPVALRKTKATPVRSGPSTPIETSLPSLVKEQATQSRKSSYTSTGIQGTREQYGYTGISKDPSLGGISASDMATGSDTLVAAAEDEETERLLLSIRQKASSQLLGNQNDESSQNSDSRTDQTTQSLRGYRSSSTLRSFYDPQKIPLSVSQQTSNSSARDFALRKGCPPVVSTEKPIPQSPRWRKNLDGSTPKNTKTSLIRLDLSMLFPKPSPRHGHLISSQIGRGPSDMVSEQLVAPPAVPLGPSTSQKHRLNIANANKAPPLLRKFSEPALSLDTQQSSRMRARTPKGGIKNWFDNFEDIDVENVHQHKNAEPRPPTSRDTQPRNKITPAELEAYYHNPYDTPLQYKRLDPNTGSSQSRLKMLPTTERRTVNPTKEELRLVLHNRDFRSKRPGTTSATHFQKRRSNPFDDIDVHKDSVLWLSSSDDESEAEDSPQSDIGSAIPGIRDSLTIGSSDNSEAEIGTAHAIKTKRPKLEQDSPLGESRSQASRVSKYSIKTVNIPERHSSRIFSFVSDQSRPLPNTREGSVAAPSIPATPSELVGNYLHSPTSASQKHNSVTRLMTVTPQEQSLLEAIRSKQASRRQNIILETFPRTSELEQGESNVPTRRPHTSGVGGHSASFFHLSQESMPTVAPFHNHRRSISAGELLESSGTESRKSCSIDLITSRRDSLAYSSLPSSSSQECPPTPTLESTLDTSTRRANSSTKRYSTLPSNYPRHSRIRTGSSGVIVLENLDDDSSSRLKPDDLPIWVFNGWFDKPGLAVLH